jgi:hypothetical protein
MSHKYRRVHITFEAQDGNEFTEEDTKKIYDKCACLGWSFFNGQVRTNMIAIPEKLKEEHKRKSDG